MAQPTKDALPSWAAMALSAPANTGQGMADLIKINPDQDSHFEAGLRAVMPKSRRLITDYAKKILPPGPEIEIGTHPLYPGTDGLTMGDTVYIKDSIPQGSVRQRAVIGHELAHVADSRTGYNPGPEAYSSSKENIEAGYKGGPHHRNFQDTGPELGMGQSMAVQRALQDGMPEGVMDPRMRQLMPWAFEGPRLASPKEDVVTNPWTYMKASSPK